MAEGTGQASVLDEPTPPLLAPVSMGNRSAAGQSPVLITVGQRPLPRLPPQLTVGALALCPCDLDPEQCLILLRTPEARLPACRRKPEMQIGDPDGIRLILVAVPSATHWAEIPRRRTARAPARSG
jgi:hypothetical protein